MPTGQAVSYRLHRTFDQKLRTFPEELYRLNPNDHLTKLLRVLLEDTGVGQLYKSQAVARLSESLGGTQFSELDYFFGTFLRFSRLGEETYNFDPYTDQLTAEEWRQIERKDAQYRERIALLLQAINRGCTIPGLSMAAEAACGFPCVILESWRYNESLGIADLAGRVPGAMKEIVVIPKLTDGTTLDNSRRRAIFNTLTRLKPADSVITVDENGLAIRQVITFRHVASPSEYYEIRKYVTGVELPPAPVSDRYFWVQDGVEQEAPSFAHLQTMQSRWQLNNTITTVETFEIAPDLSVRTMSPSMDPNTQQWGMWREFETADSPDNYPTGKFPGDPTKYNASGVYLHAWTSQQEYVIWWTAQVLAVGGEVSGGQYRLPLDAETVPSTNSRPEDSVAPMRLEVTSTYYPS